MSHWCGLQIFLSLFFLPFFDRADRYSEKRPHKGKRHNPGISHEAQTPPDEQQGAPLSL